MANDIESLEEQLNKILPHIINDSTFGPYISMSRMLDIVVKLDAYRGKMYDNSSLFADSLISDLCETGQMVSNAHRLTLRIGSENSLSLIIMVEAPGDRTHVRFRLRYTDGTISAESAIGYGSQTFTAERFRDIMAGFETHRTALVPKLDILSREIMRRRMERKLFEQALPFFVEQKSGSFGHTHRLELHSKDYREGAILHLYLPKGRRFSAYLSMERFENQLDNIPLCLEATDSTIEIIDVKQLNRHELRTNELRNMLPESERDKVTTSHFVFRARQFLKDLIGNGNFKICYLTGMEADLFLLLPENKWLKWGISHLDYKSEIASALEKRTALTRLMYSLNTSFTIE